MGMAFPCSRFSAIAVDGLNAGTKFRFRERELFLMPGIFRPNPFRGVDKDMKAAESE
jgi:hypothetical protein